MARTPKLGIDRKRIEEARAAARRITGEIQRFIDRHTTVAVERATLRLYGVEGADAEDVPLANRLVEEIQDGGGLARGATWWLANAVCQTGLPPVEIARRAAAGAVGNICRIPPADPAAVRQTGLDLARQALERVDANRRRREALIARWGERPTPWLYVIVATGNIYEDVVQAQSAARMGADVIAVIRSTAQSLLDYVPEGATTEGYGGTYATQANFRIMRQALDEVSEELGRYVRLTNYASGLCMPEIAALGALERLDMMLSDSMYGILFRDINPRRTFVDQHFARMIQGRAGIIINTGEDNYLTTDDAYSAAHTVLASQFINEQFAFRSGMPAAQIGLGHAFEMDPDLPDGLLYQWADALLSRECFPEHPLKYMPPTRYMTGNIFKGHLMDCLCHLTAAAAGWHILLVGVLTEAIHTPFLHDRYLALENARYAVNYARSLASEVAFKPGGLVQRRARQVLQDTLALLAETERRGLWAMLAEGTFGRMRRPDGGGKGLEGVIERAPDYWNPFYDLILGGEADDGAAAGRGGKPRPAVR